MITVNRILPSEPVASLDDYRAGGGLAGLDAARAAGADTVVAELEASGLRGRGGAGFPTGRKWRTVSTNRSDVEPATVVVNGAEGEPGTYKDRAILAANPYQVVEGALIAALVVGADRIVFGVKPSSGAPLDRLRAAIDEISRGRPRRRRAARGVRGSVGVPVRRGDRAARGDRGPAAPAAGRAAVPARRRRAGGEPDASGLSADVDMAGPDDETEPRPALVDNVETLANVPAIVAKGAGWFREMGTDDVARHDRLHGGRLDEPRRSRRGRHGHDPARGRSTRSAAGPAPVAPSPRSRRACPPRSLPAVGARHRRSPTRRWSPPAAGSGRAASPSSTTRTTSWPRWPARRGSSPSSPAASARRASRTAGPSPTCSPRSPAPSSPTTSSARSRTGCARWPTRRAASSPASRRRSCAACSRRSPRRWWPTSTGGPSRPSPGSWPSSSRCARVAP